MNEVFITIGNIIVNMISNELYTDSISICERFKLYCFKIKINKWLKNYILNKDGTILTTELFDDFIKHEKPLEKMFSNITGKGESLPKEVFVNLELDSFQKYSDKKKITAEDASIFKEFCLELYERIDSFYRSTLSKNQRYILGRMEIFANQMDLHIQSASDKNDLNYAKLLQTITDENERLSEPSAIWDVYDVLSCRIMNGEISDVKRILPYVKSKNQSLEYGLNYLIEVLSQDKIEGNELEMLDKEIKDDQIYDDLIMKTIYIFYGRNSVGSVKINRTRNVDLYDIANSLFLGRLDNFFSIKTKKDGFSYCSEIQIHDKYPKYNWLVKRICILEMLKSGHRNASETISQILGSPDNIIDVIFLYEQKTIELLSQIEYEANDVNTLVTTLDELQGNIQYLSYTFRVKYYLTCLRVRLLQSKDEVRSYYRSVPDDLKHNGQIVMIRLQAEIELGIVDEEELLRTCFKEEEYWLLINYLHFLINVKNENVYAKTFIEKYIFTCDKEGAILLIYVQLTNQLDKKEDAIKLLEDYEEQYGNRLDYWVTRLSIEYEDAVLEKTASRWLNSEVVALSQVSVTAFIRLLVQHGYYEYALQGILCLEKTGLLSLDLKKMKAFALLRTNREIEALEIYKNLYMVGEKTEENVYYVLALSVKNKRVVPAEIVERAKGSNNAQILALTAEYISLNASHEEAERLSRRALFRCSTDDIRVYGQYLNMQSEYFSSSPAIVQSVDINTATYLTSKSGEKNLVICIHPKDELPKDSMIWESSRHINVNTAIKLGIFKKRVNDVINIDKEEFSISHIESMDVFLSKICLQKLVSSGKATLITVGTDKDGHIEMEKFSQQIREIIGDDTSCPTWITQYKNLASVPVPFSYCAKYGRVTYTQLISLIVEDPSIIYRELLGNNPASASGYILSTSALVSLASIGYILDPDNSDTVIPNTLKQVVSENADKAISEYKKDSVASLGVQNGELYFVEATEPEKDKIMSEAVALKDYAEQFPEELNENDIVFTYNDQLDIKEMFGIADYDAISIAKKKGLTLVSSEVPLSVMCGVDSINVPYCCIADFLAHKCEDWAILTNYIKRMLECRFIIPFTIATVYRLEAAYSYGIDEEKALILGTWRNILRIPMDDDSYKLQMGVYYKEMISQKVKEEECVLGPMWRSLINASLEYLGYTIQISWTEEGEIITELKKGE